MYERSKGKASQASYNRAKEMTKEGGKWGLVGSTSTVHPIFLRSKGKGSDSADTQKKLNEDRRRKELLRAVSTFKPNETVLEIGARGNAETAALMKQRRKALNKAAQRAQLASTSSAAAADDESEDRGPDVEGDDEVEMADEADIAVRVSSRFELTTGTERSIGCL